MATLDRELVAAGHESVVVAAHDSRVHGELFGTATVPLEITDDYYRFRYIEHSRKIHEALQSGPIDLVHMHGYDFWEFLPNLDVPVLATLHLPPHWYAKRIYSAQRPHLYLNCVSDSQRADVPQSAQVLQTVPNGVTIPPIAPLPMWKRSGAVILGRICPEKGTHLGIAAARRIGMRLTIAGRPYAYPEHLQYFQKQILPAVGSDVVYTGALAWREKIDLLRSAKCVLIPSIVPETSSLVAMEALACGTPVIAMRSGALPEIVEHGKTGFIVDTAEMMSKAMLQLDKIDPLICRRTAVERFSARRMAREYMQLYEKLIETTQPVSIGSGGQSATASSERTA